ncbi:DUF2011 domain-containing protein [Fusarium coicis]|nr:DUF2011 domain-containing protein [Fusarium coicis]
MFEVPEAKRVRREDLDKSDDGAENWSVDGICDAELRAKLNEQIARSLGLEVLAEPTLDVAMKDCSLTGSKESRDNDIGESEAIPAAKDDEEEEFVFRLFSKAPPSQKVVLEEDHGPTGDGTFVSGRPLNYYVVQNVSAERKHEYTVAAEMEERKAAEVKKLAEKEEHVKDKKKRMNRLKKLRKRAKAKGQKQALKEGDADHDSNADSSGSE